MPTKEFRNCTCPRTFLELQREDVVFDWRFDPKFPEFPESRDRHHRPPATWAGLLQAEYGQHRRGPNARDF